MSDAPLGDGWWQATDGKWYPPEQHPSAATPPQPPPHPTAEPAQTTGPPTSAVQQTGPAGTPSRSNAADGDGDESSSKRSRLVLGLVLLALLIAGVIAAVLLTGGGGGDDDDDDGATDTANGAVTTPTDNDIGDATRDRPEDGPIEFDTEYADALEADRTEARYVLDAPNGAAMTLRVSNEAESSRAVFATLASAGDRYASFRVQPGGTESETVVLDDSGGAPFELTFTEGPAAFTFEVTLEVQDDAGEGGDAGAEFSSAFSFEPGQEVTARLGGDDTTDHYTVDVSPGSEFTMNAAVSRESDRAVLFVVQLAGDRLFSERVQPGAETSLSLLLNDTDEGTLEVIATEGPAQYSFTAGFSALREGGAAGDAPADLANARSIDPTADLEGQVGERDEGDHYTFTAPSATLRVQASSAATSQRAYLLTVTDANGNDVGSIRVQPGATTTETVDVEAGAVLRLRIAEGRASYSISFG